MILKTWDETGEQTRSDQPTRQVLEEAVAELNWQSEALAGMTLQRDDRNWAEASGSLQTEIGLCLMLEDNGVQHVGASAPAGLEEVVEFLATYLSGDMPAVFEILYERPFQPHDLSELRAAAATEQGGPLWPLVLLVVLITFVVLFVLL